MAVQSPKRAPDRSTVKLKPSSHQPNKAELETDMSVGTTPEALAEVALRRVNIEFDKGITD